MRRVWVRETAGWLGAIGVAVAVATWNSLGTSVHKKLIDAKSKFDEHVVVNTR